MQKATFGVLLSLITLFAQDRKPISGTYVTSDEVQATLKRAPQDSVTDQQILLLSFCFAAPDASQDYNARNKMARSLLRRLLGQRQPSQGQGQQVSPTTSTTKDQRHLTSLGLASERPGVEPIPKRVSLFAFVDPKDPFTPGEIAGEHFIGPVLSIMSARQIDSLFLFHTPHTHENARATEKELSARFPACRVELYELPVSDPKDYSSLMAQLARQVRLLMAQFAADINYVCVSSGTAEMRAAWFLLTAIGVLPAKLLQVGTPAKPLFGEANVREVVDTKDWQAIRDLLMPAMYISPRILREAPRDAPPSDDAPIFGRGHRQAKTTSAPSPSIPPAAPRRLRLGDVSKQPGVDGASPSTDTESEPFAWNRHYGNLGFTWDLRFFDMLRSGLALPQTVTYRFCCLGKPVPEKSDSHILFIG